MSETTRCNRAAAGGFYQEGITNTCERYWYKVSGGGSVQVSYSNETRSYVYRATLSRFWATIQMGFLSQDYHVGFLPIEYKHWTTNPFIKNE